jgi:chromosome segregation ATPase
VLFTFAQCGDMKRMQWSKAYRNAQKRTFRAEEAVEELEKLASSIDRAETMLAELRDELEKVSVQHQGRRTTREDIAFLTDMLKCAKKKLAWEKQIAALRKRAPEVLTSVVDLVNDPKSEPSNTLKLRIVETLHAVQTSMQRLDAAVAAGGEAPPTPEE